LGMKRKMFSSSGCVAGLPGRTAAPFRVSAIVREVVCRKFSPGGASPKSLQRVLRVLWLTV
jgi:hypothetical protein